MLSSPVSGTKLNDLLEELWLQGITGGDVTDGSANVWMLDLASQSWSAVLISLLNPLLQGKAS